MNKNKFNHEEKKNAYISLACISSIRLPLSFATALASIVLPVPGGPNNNTPEMKLRLRIPC